jgi:outer membrane protein assembly factor BamD (BamD/ComL family)
VGKIYQFGINDSAKAVSAYENLLAKFPDSLYLDEARNQIVKLKDKIG